MANAGDDDDIDVESLQAQIDMSMAFTQNLVSSWVKSSLGKMPTGKVHNDQEKDLEEYMRMPSRLGVGAAPPETTTMLSRETARLKNKLTGSAGRKHAREEDRSAVTVPSDDEEESRAGAIRKKAKVDPFEKLKEGKGKKKKDQSNEMSVESGVSMALNPDQSSKNDEVSGNTHGITLDEQQDKQHSGQSDLLNYVLGKKKRQKLMKDSVVNLATSPAPSSLNVIASAAASISGSCNCAEMSHDLISNPKHKGTNSSGLTQLEKSPSSDITRKTITAGIESTVLSISASPIVKSTSKSITVSGLPLLNLNGPPGQPEDAAILSSKKKRKRRKKKKKSLGDVVNAEDEPNGKVS